MATQQDKSDWLKTIIAVAEIGYFINRAQNNTFNSDYWKNLLLRLGFYSVVWGDYTPSNTFKINNFLSNALSTNTLDDISSKQKITQKQKKTFITLADNKPKMSELLTNKANKNEAKEIFEIVNELKDKPKFDLNNQQNAKLKSISKELEKRNSLKFKVDELYINNFRIFNDFRIKFDSNVSIIIGENGSGKSTLIEFMSNAIARIFLTERSKEINMPNYDLGGFELNYSFYNNTENNKITIRNEGDSFNPKFESIKFPERIIVSYSGITERLKQMIEDNFEDTFVGIINRDGSKYSISQSEFNLPKNRFYYAKSDYLSLIYCALTFSEKEEAKQLLDKIGVEISGCAIKFVKGKTYYKYNGKFSGNIAYEFFGRLSVFEIGEALTGTFMMQDMFHEFKKDISSQEVFDILYYLKLNKLIDDIKISWKTESGSFDLEHISEGQKQELMTLGLSLVFDTPGTLFLLDEPDTYLHPKWQREFISSLTKATANGGCAIITSHSPSIVSDVRKEQLFILNKGKLVETAFNNYGKEVDNILIDYFGLDSTRSKDVQERIDYLREMIANDKYTTDEFKNKFDELSELIGSDSKDLPLLKLDIKRREYAKNK
ncbi:MAG: AAA family ATPase [Bacteroidales bacterium]|nr:AAA family ATPase [Bacteroidales bacterium]